MFAIVPIARRVTVSLMSGVAAMAATILAATSPAGAGPGDLNQTAGVPASTGSALAMPASVGPSPVLALFCVGGPPMTVVAENLKVTVSFAHAPAAGLPGQAGECSLADRPLADSEPTNLVYAGGGQTAADLARLAAQPVPFIVVATLSTDTLQVTSVVTPENATGVGGSAAASTNTYGPGCVSNDDGSAAESTPPGPGSPVTSSPAGAEVATSRVEPGPGVAATAGPGSEVDAYAPGAEENVVGPGTGLNVTGPGSDVDAGVGAESNPSGPGSEGPGTQTIVYAPGTDANASAAEGPGGKASAVNPAPGAALPAVDFSGEWQISGNYGEHFTLTLSSSADGAVAGTYFQGKAGTFPKGDILAGQVIGNQLLAHYSYQSKKGQSDTGEILFMLSGLGRLTALWTDGNVAPTPDTAGGTWDGVRSDIASRPQ
jgi:hypothetical protein